ncbi:AAA domain-containing protein [Cytidiella melzeri]|nr:AAA domain-containing protein [Cytidiella melzeri]
MTKHGVWLVAQSNVAVKNMAEKLVEVGFHAFKLLVSHDFHFDWHEHLYGHVLASNLIRSDQFPHHDSDTITKLAGSRVILCSLSMFSSPRIVSCGFTRIVPVNVVIVDEASQIEVGDYLPLLTIFAQTVKKLVFIGDDKQHRMPTPIGNFISGRVYSSRLKSQHNIHDLSCCKFVDVVKGAETRAGHSFKNVEEANCAVRIAKRYHSEGKTYRLITPYDGQRSLIETLLKNAGIPWEDRCFNVDSFQGNEADYIIISVVRTEKVGFLSNRRRSNVMLSRCKRGMIICTSRTFVNGKASSTLLGDLCAEWGSAAWLSLQDILAGNF